MIGSALFKQVPTLTDTGSPRPAADAAQHFGLSRDRAIILGSHIDV